MRSKISMMMLAAVAGVGLSGASAMADITFGLPDQLGMSNTWLNIDLTTAAAIPNDTYGSISITYDFDSVNGFGGAWSSEGRSWFSSMAANANTNSTPTFPGGNVSYKTSVTNNTGGASNSAPVNGLQFNATFSTNFTYTGVESFFFNYRQAFAPSVGQTVDWRNISVTLTSYVPPAPPSGTIDLGTLNPGGMLMSQNAYTANTVQWYKFTLAAPIPSGELFHAHTAGNTLTGGTFGAQDTEIALFDPAGNVIGTYDDTGSFRWSEVQIGSGLVAGDYYIAAAAYNLSASNGWVASAADAGTVSGDIKLTIVPAPASAALLGLGGLVATRRRRR